MPAVGINDLKPGAIAAADVVSRDGRVLLASGGKVEPWHINLFKGLGVLSVEVGEPARDGHLEQAARYVREFFVFVNPDHPVVTELYAFASDFVAHRMSEGWRLPSLAERRAENVEHLSDVFPMEVVAPEKIVAHEVQLASFPDVYFKLREEMESASGSVQRLADIITRDVSLTARMLKLANSPIYAPPQPVESIQRAIAVIGTDELSTLALGVSAINYFKGIPPELIDMETFWRHSVAAAIFSHIFAKALGEKNTERFFIAGLLHDVGRLILFKDMPYVSSETLLHARENSLPIVVAEETFFSFTHTDVSRALLEKWGFPPQISTLVNHHHNPLDAPVPREAAIIHLADFFANAVGVASGGMYALPPMEEKAWDLTGLPASSVRRICADYEAQAEVMFKAFF
ncbi:MAG: HDOD domain-containing protein [Thermodesulfobacteriota bacterium]